MIAESGHYALVLALALALIQSTVPMLGAHQRDVALMNVGRSAALAQLVFAGLSFIALITLHVTSDFSVANVFENSHSMKPLLYKITGVWGNHEGSMLLWVSILALFGAMVASGILHGTDLVEGGLPEWMRGIALIGIGALIGSRFARMRVKTLLSHVKAALGSFAIAVAISAAFVTVIVLVTHVRFSDTIVAFAPGAMDAMMALALTLHIDPIFVGAHHLSRFVFVTIATPGIIHLFGRPQEDVDD